MTAGERTDSLRGDPPLAAFVYHATAICGSCGAVWNGHVVGDDDTTFEPEDVAEYGAPPDPAPDAHLEADYEARTDPGDEAGIE